MVKKYTPEKGDIVFINFSPQKGHEQAGKRPALVISTSIYNDLTGLGLFCPITSKAKDYPFEVDLLEGKIKGVVLADHIRSLDWKNRGVQFVEKASRTSYAEVVEKLETLIKV